ncbi:uncharacterized protein LOC114376671 [Glycine soja]|uniref:uncharacterized protein LOC114376671 n=1 Tax=Glycine soja TaxID=3848 RepID=UPI00104053C7|nr:uncharacterized protein LOC114376671 [Glycine soja]
MDSCKPIGALMECKMKLSKFDKAEKVDVTNFKSLVGSLQYLTCTRLDILYVTGLISRYMETQTITHLKATKGILLYIKGSIIFGLWFLTSNDYKLVGYSDNNWAGDKNDRKSTSEFVLFMGNTTFT